MSGNLIMALTALCPCPSNPSEPKCSGIYFDKFGQIKVEVLVPGGTNGKRGTSGSASRHDIEYTNQKVARPTAMGADAAPL